MKPTEILKDEHRIIEQVLQALEGIATLAGKESKLAREDAASAIDFIRNFADKLHHAKEEDLLFTEMEAVGFPREGGPIAVMLHEHDFGRGCVRKMADALDAAGSGDAGAIEIFCQNAGAFTGMLRAHIQKEDNILYPMADDAFDDATQAELLSAFAEAEAGLGGDAVRDKYIESAKQLQARYGAYAEASEASASGFGCGHFA
jgi:hemerythrin-like domain-containing protein